MTKKVFDRKRIALFTLLDNKTVSMGRVVMEANLNRGVSSLSLYQDETYEQGINALGMKESRSSIRLKNGNELA